MTHEQLNEIGPRLERKINERITEEAPTWSRYAAHQMVERVIEEIAPDWEYVTMRTVNSVPQIRLTRYNGEVQ